MTTTLRASALKQLLTQQPAAAVWALGKEMPRHLYTHMNISSLKAKVNFKRVSYCDRPSKSRQRKNDDNRLSQIRQA